MRSNLFKWKHLESSIIISCVHWYLKYSFSFRDLAEIMQEGDLMIQPSTTNSMLDFKTFNSTCSIIARVKTLHLMHKGQAG
jgi:hypothetical protein